MKINGKVWFMHRGKCIGIVWGTVAPSSEIKAYIGVIDFPSDEENDAKVIAETGSPFILTDEVLENFKG